MRRFFEMKASVTLFAWLFLILSVATPVISADRKIPYADAVPFLGIEEASKQLKKAVCAVQLLGEPTKDGKKTWVPVGSGFLVGGEGKALLAVTCKHVILPAMSQKKPLFIGIETDQGYHRAPCDVVYIDPSLDIAVLLPKREEQDNRKLQSLSFAKEVFDDGSSLVEGRGVLIPGYPLALGIENDENHPVIRFGIVAQFTGKDYFLLDGVASHGNSGSPVFSLKQDDNKLIGMVTSFQNERINLFDDNHQLSASLPYNSGLARCVTMKAILEAIKNAKY
jgi:S1-C subfamily serine protease